MRPFSFSSVALLCALATALLSGSASAAGPLGHAPVPRPDLKPGDAIRVGGLAVSAPRPGRFVLAESYGPKDSEELAVSTDPAGRVFVSSGSPQSDEPAELTEADTSPHPCDDGEWNHFFLKSADGTRSQKHKWHGTFSWSFNVGTTPDEISAGAAESDLQHATENIKWARNDCGLPDQVNATSSYLGTTSVGTQVTSSGNCSTPDSASVVGFGTIYKEETVALACVWGYFNDNGTYAFATTSDVKFDKDDHEWYTDTAPSGCTNRYSLESVATHERGHTFGLAHVPEDEHGKLTMSRLLNGPCQRSERTLGLGDIRGLNTIYP